MPAKTIHFRMKLPSFSVRLVKPPQVNLTVNPLVLVLLAALLLYASFENTRVGMADVRREFYQGLGGLAEGLNANLTALAGRSGAFASSTPPGVVRAPAGDSELVKSLSMSVEGMSAMISDSNSLDRYYSSKLQTTNVVRLAAANAAQKSYSDNADQCLKLSDSEDGGREKNMTNCRNAKSIYYWVRDSVKFEPAYERGYLKGEVQLPSETLSSPVGGSADHAVLLASLLRSRGMDAYLVAIPAADYMVVAARIVGLPDTYLDSISWKTATSTGIKQPPYDYFGDKKELVLLDAECKVCAFGILRDEHRKMDMKMLTYYNATGNS